MSQRAALKQNWGVLNLLRRTMGAPLKKKFQVIARVSRASPAEGCHERLRFGDHYRVLCVCIRIDFEIRFQVPAYSGYYSANLTVVILLLNNTQFLSDVAINVAMPCHIPSLIVWQEIALPPNSPSKFASADYRT